MEDRPLICCAHAWRVLRALYLGNDVNSYAEMSIPRESHKGDDSLSSRSTGSSSAGSVDSCTKYNIAPMKFYADNATNRKLGRVGKRVEKGVGKHVGKKGAPKYGSRCVKAAAQKGSHSKLLPSPASKRPHLKFYADNEQNRKSGRVGKIRGTHIIHKNGSITVVTPPSRSVLKEYIGRSKKKARQYRNCKGNCKYNRRLIHLRKKVKEACLKDQQMVTTLGHIY